MKPLRWRYEVTEVWGTMIGRLEVGAEITERVWKGRGVAYWDIMDMSTHRVTGGWVGHYLGHYEPEATDG
jgi:hypothetical protein